uniref:Unconventional myosin-XVIIIa n=1 Tax=Geospiza parvula TaxID=87175 RepID=A0A8U8CEU7_GEOPR
MFNLMKKDKEKDGARKEKKKEKKERMSAAELKSLEEMSMRRGFFNLNRASKRDSKTRLEISNPIPIKVASGSELHLTDIDSDSNRGSVILDSGHLSTASSSDDLKADDTNFKGSVLQRAAKFGSLAKQNSQVIVKRFSFSQKSRDESTSETSTPSEHSAAPSPQVEVRMLDTPLDKQGVPPGQPCTPPAASLRARVPELVGKKFPAELRLPALVPPQPPTPRQLELQRRNTGDFGFSLRRTTMLDRGPDGQVYRRVVHFAEPGAGTKDLALGLVPGDRLVEINGRNVENKSRDEIVEMIRQSGETVQLKVQPILELSELSRCWLRGGQGTRRAAWDAKTEEQIAAEEAWYETEKVWLVHRDGFSLGSQLRPEAGSPLPEGKVKVKLDHDGAVLEVEEDDVEKANPPSCDRVEDLASLLYLNESSTLHTLRQRYGGNLLHTYAGPTMVIINPLSSPSMYSEKVMHMFKGCRREDTSPHIYAVAQAAYRSMLMSRQDQAIVLLGASGSGKTTNCQHLVQYLATIAGSTGKVFSVEKWQALYTILEAFGNSSTSMNGNGTRFSQIISLDFDQAGQVASASVQTLLLEKLRVTRHPANEATFNVFYYLLACSDSTLRTELHFSHLAENNVFGIVPPSKPEEKQKATQQFSKLLTAMKVMGISGDEQKAFWLILGAIYHLGAAGATKAGRKQFARHEWAQKAAYLLGCSLEELSSAIFKHQPKGTLQRSTSFRQGPDESPLGDSGTGPKLTALECLEGMAAGLYSELFTLLISLLNRALKSSQHSVCSVTVVDTPGAQNPKLAGQSRGATFEELCHNYAQERLQQLFHQRTFARELERYKEENIELALADAEPSSSGSIAAVDQSSHQALVSTFHSSFQPHHGSRWPGGNEDTLLERLFSYYGPQEGGKKGHNPLLPSDKPRHFLLGHSSGTNWVEYDATGWLNYVKHNPASQNASVLLQESQKKVISSLFAGRGGSALVLSGSVAGLEGGSQLALRRATSMRKTFTTGVAAVKKKSLCIQIKLQVDALIDSIKKSKLHFVHCFLPKAGAGGDPQAVLCRRVSGSELELPAEHCEAGLMQLDVPLLRAQLRGSRLLDALRMYRQGYPDHMVFAEFRRRFDVLAPHLTKKHGRNYIVVDEKRVCAPCQSHCCGPGSPVFFRAGSLARLEEQRDTQTSRNITLFQAACRGFLARQHFKKRKIQDLAIRCVQKNIKKNKGVKDWPWWKLFTTVRPLIEVQLTEDQIRGKDEEIQQLKSKLEKVEKERNELRLNSDRLESRITELTSELTDERNTGESASQLLDAETAERLRAEKEMKDLQAKYDALKKQMESMEMEVMEARLIRAAELNGELDDDDSGGEWRLKYERAVREIDFTKKRLQQELEDKLEVEQQGKRQLERKLADLQADSEESQRALQQLKKKCQRLAAELQDTKLHLEGQQGRNHDLEKKQRRFDSELSQAHEEVQRERLQREKLSREKDVLVAEVFGLKQLLEDRDSDIAGLTQKAETLEAELQDISSQESKDEASLAKVKKQLRDLEAKVKDQEEELDEQAGTIQMLEQAKLRLEMEMERLRQTHAKEVESRDEEVEEIRQSCQKKLKQMEVQLEEEYEDKQKVLREKRELESKLSAVSEQANQRDFETEKRLRRDLKRTKALLADAQIMLDHLKNNAPSKREITQLKNQLEESEFTCAAAVKARKSMEVEIEDLHLQIDDLAKAKGALEEQLSRLQREKNEVQSRLEEDQEDMNELMKKHKAAVAQASRDLAQMNDLQAQLEEVSKEKQELQEKLQGLQSQLEFLEQSMVDKSLVSRQEAKIRELETRLEFERTQVKRLESLATRLKENMEKLTEERDQRAAAENREKEQNKRLQRQLRDVKEEMGELAKKEAEASRKKHELEMDLESLEAANQSLQSDLKLAFKRIGDLQAAIEDEMEKHLATAPLHPWGHRFPLPLQKCHRDPLALPGPGRMLSVHPSVHCAQVHLSVHPCLSVHASGTCAHRHQSMHLCIHPSVHPQPP